jgi:hypothetical protein
MFVGKLLRVFGLSAFLFCGSASAAFVTLLDTELDSVFGQASFGGNNIDIRFNAQQTITNPDFLNIDTSTRLNGLFAQAHDLPTINMYFVDTIDYCGGYNPSIVGCASTPGNDLVLESDVVAGSFGTELVAHELGHNLGLGHPAGSGNLMNGTLNGSTFLTVDQANSVLASSLVQTDGSGQRFLSITPYLIQATAVPVPAAAPLFLSALMGIFTLRRRKLKR